MALRGPESSLRQTARPVAVGSFCLGPALPDLVTPATSFWCPELCLEKWVTLQIGQLR